MKRQNRSSFVKNNSSFVKNNDLILAKDGPANANQLLLANTQVATVLLDLVVKTSVAEIFLGQELVLVLDLFLGPFVSLLLLLGFRALGKELLEASLFNELFDSFVTGIVPRV